MSRTLILCLGIFCGLGMGIAISDPKNDTITFNSPEQNSTNSSECLAKCQNYGFYVSRYDNNVCTCSNKFQFPMEEE